jgi:hypothetical protein
MSDGGDMIMYDLGGSNNLFSNFKPDAKKQVNKLKGLLDGSEITSMVKMAMGFPDPLKALYFLDKAGYNAVTPEEFVLTVNTDGDYLKQKSKAEEAAANPQQAGTQLNHQA